MLRDVVPQVVGPMNAEQKILVNRLKEAGLHTRRFLKVNDEKEAYEKDFQINPYEPSELEAEGCEKWGILGRTGLVLIDTDNEEMSETIRKILPVTFEVMSPRRKLPHFYFKVVGGEVQNKYLHIDGVKEGVGEIRAQNYYLVAAGTLTNYGRYEISHDRPIAEVQFKDFNAAMFPFLGKDPSQGITREIMEKGTPKGTRHDQANKLANLLIGGYKLDEPTALQAIREWNKKLEEPLKDDYLKRTIRGAGEHVATHPRPEREPEPNTKAYFVKSKDGKKNVFVPKALADAITDDHHFATHRESWDIRHYKDGYYGPKGEASIRELCRKKLGRASRDHYVSEVFHHIRDTTFRDAKDFEVPANLLCLDNGIYNLNTWELEPHTPDLLFLAKIPVEYDPEAKAPAAFKRLGEWLSEDDVIRAVQFLGFLLFRGYFIRKALIAHGEGGNGKTTFLTYAKRWVGDKNTCAIPVQNIDKNRFSAGRLYGSHANICDDLPSSEWFGTGKFKQANWRW